MGDAHNSKRLTTKARRFVEEYPVDFNAGAAALRAGYSARSARSIGAENLTKPDIQKALAEKLAELARVSNRSAAGVLAELEKLAFANMKDFIRGNLAELSPEQMAAVREVTIVQLPKGGTRVRMKLWDKRAALVDLYRFLAPAKEKPAKVGSEYHSKKAERAAAAREASIGKFAPPPPPGALN